MLSAPGRRRDGARDQRHRRGPVTGRPLALAIQTGDNSDNSQLNEVRWNIDLLDGARVRADSGDLTRYEGVGDDDAATYDRAYWHPHAPPAGRPADAAKTRYGFPTVPGLLDAARRPFRAAGLAMPWYTAFGNHDGLVQGNFPAATLQLNAIATGAAQDHLAARRRRPGRSARRAGRRRRRRAAHARWR